MEQCPHCKQKYIKKPLKDQYGRWIWKNVLIPDMQVVLFAIVIITLLFVYNHETKACETVIEDPCGFCEASNCCNYIAEKSYSNQYDFDIIDKINNGGYS